MEYDGVVVEATSDLQRKAWLKVAELEGKNPPPMWQLNRAEGMKNNQVRFLHPPCELITLRLMIATILIQYHFTFICAEG